MAEELTVKKYNQKMKDGQAARLDLCMYERVPKNASG